MQKLTIGIVGAGEISRRAHLPVLLSTPNIEVAWLYDNNGARAGSLGMSFGVPHLHALPPDQLPACDLVLLAIPSDARGSYLRHFAASGTAVLCEKPFAMSTAEHTQALAGFAFHTLGCGYMRRFYSSTMLLRRIVGEGWFGPLRKLRIREGNRSKGSGVDASFLDDPRLGAARGVLADLGSHGIDLALHVCSASAFSLKRCDKILDGAVDRKVAADIELTAADAGQGASIHLDFAVSWLDRQDNRICLTFDKVSVWSDLSVTSDVYIGEPDRPREALTLHAPVAGARTFNQAFYMEWQEFLSGFRERRESLVSARSALLTTSLVETLLAADSDAHG